MWGKALHEHVSGHVVNWDMFNVAEALLHSMMNEMVADIDMLCL